VSNKLPAYRYRIEVVRVIDGDTVEADVDLGFHTRIRTNLRVRGINCPELNTDAGKAAKAHLVHLVQQTGGKWIADTLKADKYGGRWDAVIWLSDAVSLADHMVNAGHAVYKDY
jgi:micrococcal nuclease